MKVRIPSADDEFWARIQAVVAATECAYLLALRDEHFGAERMRRVMLHAQQTFVGFRDRYCADGDQRIRDENAPHIVAMKEELKSCGLDYDDEIRRSEQNYKSRWRGNKSLGGAK